MTITIEDVCVEKMNLFSALAKDDEWSGLLIGTVDEEAQQLVVDDVLIADQTNSGASTEMDDDAVALMIFEHRETLKGKRIIGWIHTHGNGQPFFSDPDLTTIQKTFYDYNPFIAIIGGEITPPKNNNWWGGQHRGTERRATIPNAPAPPARYYEWRVYLRENRWEYIFPLTHMPIKLATDLFPDDAQDEILTELFESCQKKPQYQYYQKPLVPAPALIPAKNYAKGTYPLRTTYHKDGSVTETKMIDGIRLTTFTEKVNDTLITTIVDDEDADDVHLDGLDDGDGTEGKILVDMESPEQPELSKKEKDLLAIYTGDPEDHGAKRSGLV